MTRKGDTVLVATLKRYGKKIEKYIQNSLGETMKVKVLVEDARDSQGKASGAAYLEIEIDKKGGWDGENQVEIHGTIGFDKAGKKGKKEDEAYLDGVTVGDWDDGSKAIGLSGCSIGEFLVHMFTLFAIKAGNESVLLDNAAGPRGEHIYRQVGFIKSKGDRAQYGDDNEMIFPLTGKKKNKDAGQLWRERYNKFRKKLKTKIKSKENCKSFWKTVPEALEAPGPVHMLARGSKRRTRKKRGGDAERPPITLNKQQFINMVENNPDKVYKIIRNLRTEGMDDPDDPDYGFNVWYNGKIEYEGFDEDWGGDVFGFTMYDEDGDEIRWSDIYPALKTGPDTDALDYEWINIKDAGQPIKFVGGKRRKKRGGYGPGITPEQARQMSRRVIPAVHPASAHGGTEENRQGELSASGPGDLVTNQSIEETERSKALRKIQENNQKIIENRKHRKVEEPKKFTEEELSQIQFEPTDLKKNQIGIVNSDGTLAVASKIHVPWHKRLGRTIKQKITKKLTQRKRKTRVAPAPRVGGKKTKRRRTKRTRKRKIPTNTVENIWGKNKKLEKFWRKLASGREVILVNKNDEKTNYKLPKTHPALGNKYRELEEDDNIKAIITSAQSSDIYESLYKRVKNKTPKEIINNYKKYLIKDGKTWYL